MKVNWLVCVLVLAIFAGATPNTAKAQEARNVAEFCGIWQRICGRTCPAGSDCSTECTRRAGVCRSGGCFQFNSPGPRCFNNASDRALTDLKLAPNPERERQLRGLKR